MSEADQGTSTRPACPRCGSLDIRRSHQMGLLAAVFRILGRWPFRCRSCRARFYRADPPPDE